MEMEKLLSDVLVCGECGTPYHRVTRTQKGVKRIAWAASTAWITADGCGGCKNKY